jgi:hypothetical protein
MNDARSNSICDEEQSIVKRSYDRRSILRGAALGGAGLLGLTTLGYLPGVTNGAAHGQFGRHGEDSALRDTMRKLWEDHIVWTRGFIVSFAAGSPDLDATTQRLLRNQVDIGDALKPFAGESAGERLTELLREHILGAARLLSAAKAGDSTAVEQASAAWYVNADDIAAFLAELNPQAWPLANMQAMMREHLDLTLSEAVAQLQGDWAGSIAAYDRVHDAILHMADMLAAGIGRRGRR